MQDQSLSVLTLKNGAQDINALIPDELFFQLLTIAQLQQKDPNELLNEIFINGLASACESFNKIIVASSLISKIKSNE